MKLARYLTLTLLILLLGSDLASAVDAGDWPQFRYDSGRTAASPAELPAELHLAWSRQLSQPRPAFPAEVRLRFDSSYEPVVLGKRMFVPSMVTDTVTALDTDTGEVQWRFFTDGPVRFAPLAYQDKVYAASDDGFLYCLAADSGALVWKFRGLPENQSDRKLLGNRRLISLWAARGGPVLEDDVVYFAAGLWPASGVFVHALDAQTGKPLWSNTTSNRIPRANMDHGVAQYAGITPQGYLSIVSDRLVVPCGAQLPAFLDPKTGVLGDYTMGWGGRVGLPKGSWFAAGAGRFLSHSGDLYDIRRPNDEKFRDPRGREDFKNMLYPGGVTRLLIDPNNQRALGAFSQPVITDRAMYVNEADACIVAYDLTDVELAERAEIAPTSSRAEDRYPDRWKANFRQLWQLPSAMTVHIRAGSRLYAGGEGTVQAITIPGADERPTVAWQAEIEGTPNRMLAADGKLFVVTRQGRIYAFGGQQPDQVRTHPLAEGRLAQLKAPTSKARAALAAMNGREGYALVLGLDNGALVESLLADSELYVIAVDKDESKVNALRGRLFEAGLYGIRAAVHVGDPASYPFPPYLASLIVTENDQQLAATVPDWQRPRLLDWLRPYGGTICLSSELPESQQLVRRLADRNPAGLLVKQTAGLVVVQRPSSLPGAAPWSHAGGDAANADASQDQFLKPPLALLWYDSSLRWHRKPGSAVVRVAGGRVFVLAERLHAIDVYTGRHLWSSDVPGEVAADGEVVAVSDMLYVAIGNQCLALDAATGKRRHQFAQPPDTSGSWSNLRVSENYLVATIGKQLVCFDRNSQQMIWSFGCNRASLSVALGNSTVFCSELLNERRGETPATAGTKIRALDARSGEVLWASPAGHEVHYSESSDLLITTEAVYRGSDGERLRKGVPAPQIIGDKLVSGTTDRFTLYDVVTGDTTHDELKWTRRGCTGLRSSCHLVTTRFKANAAYVDLETFTISPLWNIRPGCNNNLFPADGVLNVPNVTGGCECNYTPTSKAFVPLAVIEGEVTP